MPLDDRGIPVFDLSLRLLYNLEKELLSYKNGGSPEAKFAELSSGRKVTAAQCDNIFVHYADLKKDHFYGALRFRARREKVEEIMRRRDCA